MGGETNTGELHRAGNPGGFATNADFGVSATGGAGRSASRVVGRNKALLFVRVDGDRQESRNGWSAARDDESLAAGREGRPILTESQQEI